MIKRLFIFLSLVLVAGASDFVRYDPTSQPVTNRVTGYLLSVDTPSYLGKTGYLQVTNRAAQSGAGVTMSNMTVYGVVDGQQVRLMNQGELDAIAAANTIANSNALVATKLDARTIASNVVSAADGMSLYIRSMGEANWFLINQIRTNLGYPALTKIGYKTMIDTNIAEFGK